MEQANVDTSSVGALSALPAPTHPTARVSPTEKTVLSVHATLTKFQLEAYDSDYHLVLDDGQGRTMITEIPPADCIGVSPFKTAIGDVRAVVYIPIVMPFGQAARHLIRAFLEELGRCPVCDGSGKFKFGRDIRVETADGRSREDLLILAGTVGSCPPCGSVNAEVSATAAARRQDETQADPNRNDPPMQRRGGF